MGLGKIIEGAPQPDPRFVLPPETPEQPISNEELLRRDNSIRRNMRIIGGLAAIVFVGGPVALYVAEQGNDPARQSAAAPLETQSASPSISNSPSESPTSPPPSPTLTSEKPRPVQVTKSSPTHIPSPSVTTSHKVVTPSLTRKPSPSPTPTKTETHAPAAACHPNENAPGEIVCDSPVWTYTSPTNMEHAFEITGGAAPDCSRIEAGRVVLKISNDEGWADLNEIGNPC